MVIFDLLLTITLLFFIFGNQKNLKSFHKVNM
jgi:hypothetical protein